MKTPVIANNIDEPVFERTWQQADIAINCLKEASDKGKDILPYLIHASVLFFTARDQQAFLRVYNTPVWESLNIQKKLRQLPTLRQLQAVLASQNADEQVLASLIPFEDKALGVENLKIFRDAIVQQGVLLEEEAENAVFQAQTVSYQALVQEALAGWQRVLSQTIVK